MPYVYSTMTSDVTYASHKVHKDVATIQKKVTIKGGSNVVNRKSLDTPYGVATKVSDEDLAFLQERVVFKEHMKAGFIRVEKSDKDPEKVIASSKMEVRDGSAPETPETLAAKGGAKVRTSEMN